MFLIIPITTILLPPHHQTARLQIVQVARAARLQAAVLEAAHRQEGFNFL